MNKKISILISILVLAILAGGGFWFVKNKGEKKDIANNQENNQYKKESEIEEIDTSNWQTYKNEELEFEIINPEKIFDTKFKIYKEDKEVVRFYDVGCEYNEVGFPAKDCVNINIHKKKLSNFTENEKKIYEYNFNDSSIINNKKFIIEWNNQYVEGRQFLYGANAIFDNEDSYYFIMIGGAYFDFTPELIERYKTFISTFKVLD